MWTRYLIAAAVVVMGVGMALIYAGVIGVATIKPGAALVAGGLVIAAIGGVVAVASAHRE